MAPLTHEQWLALSAYIQGECGLAACIGRNLSPDMIEGIAIQRDKFKEEARVTLTTEPEGLQ